MTTYANLVSYGDDKGACENIFSYGFLEDATTTAKAVFLDIDIPDDDPLRPAKIFVSEAAPGFRIFEQDNDVSWQSDFIWLVVINEEDGLDFKVRQTIDGKREIQAFWKERELEVSKLHDYLQEDPAWDIFQLRATVLLQQRVELQIETLQGTQGGTTDDASVREGPRKLAERLRALELALLERTVTVLDNQVSMFFSAWNSKCAVQNASPWCLWNILLHITRAATSGEFSSNQGMLMGQDRKSLKLNFGHGLNPCISGSYPLTTARRNQSFWTRQWFRITWALQQKTKKETKRSISREDHKDPTLIHLTQMWAPSRYVAVADNVIYTV